MQHRCSSLHRAPPPGGPSRRGTARTGRRLVAEERRRCARAAAAGRRCRRAPAPRPSRASRRRTRAFERERRCRALRARRSGPRRRRAARPAGCRSGDAAGQVEQLARASRRTAPRRHRAERRVRETQNSFVPVDVRAAGCRERVAPVQHDRQHVDQRLDVVHDRGLAEQPDLDRERRLVARLASIALDRVEQRGLLTADVGAGAAADLDVEGEPWPRMSSPSSPRRAAARWRAAAVAARAGTRRAGRGSPVRAPIAYAGDRHRLDERERVALHQHAVLERARLGLVGVGNEVVGARPWAATACHLRPVGNAAPPRPTRPAASRPRRSPPTARSRRPAQRVVAAVRAGSRRARRDRRRRRARAARAQGRRAGARTAPRPGSPSGSGAANGDRPPPRRGCRCPFAQTEARRRVADRRGTLRRRRPRRRGPRTRAPTRERARFQQANSA